jgi:hypothetical protein
MVGLPREDPRALDFDVAVMTHAQLVEAQRAAEVARHEPGMVHWDAATLGEAPLRFGAV